MPTGQKRSADIIGDAVHVMKIVTGEIVENLEMPPKCRPGRATSGRAGPEVGRGSTA